MKNLIIILALVITLFSRSLGSVYAYEQEVCTTTYGQGVVCGKKSFDEPKEIVSAGLAEDLRILGLALIASSFVLVYYKNKKGSKTTVFSR